MEAAFGGLYSNTVQSFDFSASDQVEQVQLSNYMPFSMLEQIRMRCKFIYRVNMKSII